MDTMGKIINTDGTTLCQAGQEIIIFEENLTAAGLQKIQAESKNWPAVAETKEQYDLIYSEHQRFKRLRLAVTKKQKELTQTEKQKFENEKNRINKDYDFVMSVLSPLEKQLADSRKDWDERKKAEAEEKAKIEAEKQRLEFERQEKIREEQQIVRDHEQGLKENAEFDREKQRREDLARIEAERKSAADERDRQQENEARELEAANISLEAERHKMKMERYEFECEKSRLSFDEAWEESEKNRQEEVSEVMHNICSAISENQEARHDLNKKMSLSGATVEKMPPELSEVIPAQEKPEPETGFSIGDIDAIKSVIDYSNDLTQCITGRIGKGIKNDELRIELKNFLNRVKSARRIFNDKFGKENK